MKKAILGFIALGLTVASIAAKGTETLDYQGSPFTSVVAVCCVEFAMSRPSMPSAGTGDFLTGSLVLSSPLIANGTETVIPVSYEFSVDSQLALTSDTHSPQFNFGSSDFSFTMKNGTIVGYDFSAGWGYGGPGGASLYASGGSGGDYYNAMVNLCLPVTTGSCSVNATSAVPGKWSVAAPEIDSTSAAGGLTLLFGGLAVLRGRRRWPHTKG